MSAVHNNPNYQIRREIDSTILTRDEYKNIIYHLLDYADQLLKEVKRYRRCVNNYEKLVVLFENITSNTNKMMDQLTVPQVAKADEIDLLIDEGITFAHKTLSVLCRLQKAVHVFSFPQDHYKLIRLRNLLQQSSEAAEQTALFTNGLSTEIDTTVSPCDIRTEIDTTVSPCAARNRSRRKLSSDIRQARKSTGKTFGKKRKRSSSLQVDESSSSKRANLLDTQNLDVLNGRNEFGILLNKEENLSNDENKITRKNLRKNKSVNERTKQKAGKTKYSGEEYKKISYTVNLKDKKEKRCFMNIHNIKPPTVVLHNILTDRCPDLNVSKLKLQHFNSDANSTSVTYHDGASQRTDCDLNQDVDSNDLPSNSDEINMPDNQESDEKNHSDMKTGNNSKYHNENLHADQDNHENDQNKDKHDDENDQNKDNHDDENDQNIDNQDDENDQSDDNQDDENNQSDDNQDDEKSQSDDDDCYDRVPNGGNGGGGDDRDYNDCDDDRTHNDIDDDRDYNDNCDDGRTHNDDRGYDCDDDRDYNDWGEDREYNDCDDDREYHDRYNDDDCDDDRVYNNYDNSETSCSNEKYVEINNKQNSNNDVNYKNEDHKGFSVNDNEERAGSSSTVQMPSPKRGPHMHSFSFSPPVASFTAPSPKRRGPRTPPGSPLVSESTQ